MLGATYRGDATHFRVWAPDAVSVQLVLEPSEVEMGCDGDGFWTASAALPPGGNR